jgi:glycosyltransferase involved in cell wall biosynthesis
MTLWIDVDDLLTHARLASRPSGIQRLSFEICSALVALRGAETGFVRHDPAHNAFRIIPWNDVHRAYQLIADTPRPESRQTLGPDHEQKGRRWTSYIPAALRAPLGRAAYAQAEAFRNGWQAMRALPGLVSRAPAEQQDHGVEGPLLAEVALPGDTLCVLGTPWTEAGAVLAERTKRELRLRFAMLVHDLIPVLKPEYTLPSVIENYHRWYRRCLPLADWIFANSRSTARDLEAWVGEIGLKLPGPVLPLPIGTVFPKAFLVRMETRAVPPPDSYVLFVSSIEARRNHALAFRVWRRLLQEMTPDRIPTLVFAGRIGWMVNDLLQQIRNCGNVDGKLLLFEAPTDAELAALYAGCRFTLYPSHYEGWGLPVTESLSFGKVCLASSTSSLPEAGGPFCLYFHPDNVPEAAALVRRAIEDPALVPALEARIRTGFRPVPWTETAKALLEHLGRLPPLGIAPALEAEAQS